MNIVIFAIATLFSLLSPAGMQVSPIVEPVPIEEKFQLHQDFKYEVENHLLTQKQFEQFVGQQKYRVGIWVSIPL